MKKIISLLLLFVSTGAIGQNKSYDVSNDHKSGEITFRGIVTFEDLNKEPSFAWLKSGADEYKPDESVIAVLKEQLHKYSLVVFLGTWCDDSHYLVPKLEKVLQLTGYPASLVKMYGVDREKTTTGGAEKKYGVTLVPTVILFDAGGKEAGRITESVQKSIEEDLAAIINH